MEQLKDTDLAAEFILDALENPEDGYLLKAIGQVVKASGRAILGLWGPIATQWLQ